MHYWGARCWCRWHKLIKGLNATKSSEPVRHPLPVQYYIVFDWWRTDELRLSSLCWKGSVLNSRSENLIHQTGPQFWRSGPKVQILRDSDWNYLMWVDVSRHSQIIMGWFQWTKWVNQIKQKSVIMRVKLSADTNRTQLLAILLFGWNWSMTRLLFVVYVLNDETVKVRLCENIMLEIGTMKKR